MRRAIAAASLALACAGCGKSGPPLPPLHVVPGAVSEVVARRSADEVRLTFVLPTANANGPGPLDLDRLEIYSATVAAGAVSPPNRDLLSAPNLITTIRVKPPQREGEEIKPDDPRPEAGAQTSFVETLDAAKLTPVYTTPLPAVTAEAAAALLAAGASGVKPPAPTAVRLYVIRGLTRGGRPGPPSVRIEVPLVEAPPASGPVTIAFTEKGINLGWLPPPVSEQTVAFNVYAVGGTAPLNPAPLTAPAFERPGIEIGKEECFVVRSVTTSGRVPVESAASEPACVTPRDTFPPAAPKGLSAVASSGTISLIWDANTEPDLAGYLVLRGEAPGATLQALTPTPVSETTFRDTTAKPGVRYIYAIVAVDRAQPPNTSAQSNRVEETAR